MAGCVFVDMPMVEGLDEVLASQRVTIVDSAQDASVVIRAGERLESDISTLYAGGWIACAIARAQAERLGISLTCMGEVLDRLNVKVRVCGLGCF
ncbi:MAG: hypothetical protein ACYS8X_08740 [Planctomycetota bacterium]|jgi:hypothetical protein